jgi:hypothetical protein
MPSLGIVGAWLGYAFFFYGLNLVKGGNDGFMSLLWPGKYTPKPRDGGGLGGTQTANGFSPDSGSGVGATNTLPSGPNGVGNAPVPTPPVGTVNPGFFQYPDQS